MTWTHWPRFHTVKLRALTAWRFEFTHTRSRVHLQVSDFIQSLYSCGILFVCFLIRGSLWNKRPLTEALPPSTGQKHSIASGPTTVPSCLCKKACVDCTVKKVKGKKSPAVVTVPEKYKETSPDARIWGISSAMGLCPLTEGQKNIKELKYLRAWNGYFGGPLSVCMPVTHISLTFNKQNLFSSSPEKSWYRFQTRFI